MVGKKILRVSAVGSQMESNLDKRIENGLTSLVRQIGCCVKDRELLSKLHAGFKGTFEVFAWYIEAIERLSNNNVDLTRGELEVFLIGIKVNMLERLAPHLRSLKKSLPLVIDAVMPDENEDEDEDEDEDTTPTTYKGMGKQIETGLESLRRQIRYYIKDEELLSKAYVYADFGDMFRECIKQVEAIGKLSNIDLTRDELGSLLIHVDIGILWHLVFHWRSAKKWLPLVLKEIALPNEGTTP